MDKAALDTWLLTRPQCVQDLAKEFPAGTALNIKEKLFYVIGWTESDSLIVSPIWPDDETYDAAIAAKEYVHAEHFR